MAQGRGRFTLRSFVAGAPGRPGCDADSCANAAGSERRTTPGQAHASPPTKHMLFDRILPSGPMRWRTIRIPSGGLSTGPVVSGGRQSDAAG